MGITIHYRLGQEKQYVKSTLDRTEQLAKKFQKEAKVFNIPFQIKRNKENFLRIDIGGCESLTFDFNPMSVYTKKEEKIGYNPLKDYKEFDTDPEEEHYKEYPGQIMYWTSDFTKTQFAENIIEHRFVAELIRITAGHCKITDVYDEGDYYHTGDLNDAAESIEELGVFINDMGKELNKEYGKDNVVKGGETKVKKRKINLN